MRRTRGEGRRAKGEGEAQPARRSSLALVASLLVLVVVPLPFDVGLPGTPVRWSIVERAAAALNRYTSTSYSAFNLWTSPLGAPAGVELFKQPDRAPWLLGLSYQLWGLLFLVAAYGGVLAWYWRRNGMNAERGPGTRLRVASAEQGRGSARGARGNPDENLFRVPRSALRAPLLVWACLAVSQALFVLPTRVHERYIFPALVFGALATALAPRLGSLYAGLTLVSFANLYYVYAQFFAPPRYRFPWLYQPDLFVHAMSLLNVALLLCTLFLAPRLLERVEAEPVAEPAVGGEENGRAGVVSADPTVAAGHAGRAP